MSVEEGFVFGHGIARRALGDVPCVDFGLKLIALFQQRGVFRGEVFEDGGEAGPELVCRHAGSGKRLADDEVVQRLVDLQSGDFDACAHPTIPFKKAAAFHHRRPTGSIGEKAHQGLPSLGRPVAMAVTLASTNLRRPSMRASLT